MEADFNTAKKHFDLAYHYQMAGDLDNAVEHYELSILAHPTAEAHTFLGWTYSFMGRIEEAIDECKKAIATDPDFGNPYNDIGAYLVELGREEDAIPWFLKAMQAKRYECYHYPHFNLGRIYEHRGKWNEAMREYAIALKEYPDYEIAKISLARLVSKRTQLN